jgi:sec-independent protein translocase protein TatA
MADLFDSPWKILIIAVVIIVLFGSKKLPVAARSLGRSMRILKSEVSTLHDDDETESGEAAPPTAKTVQPQIASAPAPAATDQSLSAQQTAAAQAQIDSLQEQIREMKESSVKETASVPADQKPV